MTIMNIIDLESTGIQHFVHEILEISILPVDLKTLKQVSDIYTSKVFPTRIRDASPEALRINKYDPSIWAKEAVGLKTMLQDITPMITGGMWGGQNPAFDFGFIEWGFFMEGLRFPKMTRRMMDTATLALPLYSMGLLPGKDIDESLSLENLCKFFGIKRHDAHTAHGDVFDTLEVLRNLMNTLHYTGMDWGVSGKFYLEY